jgi:hypothetical protein
LIFDRGSESCPGQKIGTAGWFDPQVEVPTDEKRGLCPRRSKAKEKGRRITPPALFL